MRNPRGRVIKVNDSEVKTLLRKGFLRCTDQEAEEMGEYNHVFDKGPGFTNENPAPPEPKKEQVPALGDALRVELI